MIYLAIILMIGIRIHNLIAIIWAMRWLFFRLFFYKVISFIFDSRFALNYLFLYIFVILLLNTILACLLIMRLHFNAALFFGAWAHTVLNWFLFEADPGLLLFLLVFSGLLLMCLLLLFLSRRRDVFDLVVVKNKLLKLVCLQVNKQVSIGF